MPSMRVSLPGLFANIKAELPKRCRGEYGFMLDEVLGHLEATARGEHTIEEFAKHYCIKTDPLQDSGAVLRRPS